MGSWKLPVHLDWAVAQVPEDPYGPRGRERAGQQALRARRKDRPFTWQLLLQTRDGTPLSP